MPIFFMGAGIFLKDSIFNRDHHEHEPICVDLRREITLAKGPLVRIQEAYIGLLFLTQLVGSSPSNPIKRFAQE